MKLILAFEPDPGPHAKLKSAPRVNAKPRRSGIEDEGSRAAIDERPYRTSRKIELRTGRDLVQIQVRREWPREATITKQPRN